MTDYLTAYRLQAMPEARNDGSAYLVHEIWADHRPTVDDDWAPIPGHHETILIGAQDVLSVLESGTDQQKIEAYKQLLAEKLGTTWSPSKLKTFLDANDLAQSALSAIEGLVDDIGINFPIRFTVQGSD